MQVYERHFSGAIRGSGGSSLVVELRGELDADSQAEADGLLARAAATARSDVRVDVSGLRFIGAGGLGSLAVLADRVERRGGRVVLVGARPLLVRLLEIAGIAGAFSFEPVDDHRM